ncbi:MAG: hypothetical protein JWN47_1189, partial [Frankiales bacterium]|nr:hypothetical protein [Frankiales bacterium]
IKAVSTRISGGSSCLPHAAPADPYALPPRSFFSDTFLPFMYIP